MRFRGGGVGHTSTREATSRFLVDRDRKDVHAVVTTSDTAMNIDQNLDGLEGDSDDLDQERDGGLGRGLASNHDLGEEKGGFDSDENSEMDDEEEAGDEGNFTSLADEELDYGYYNQGSGDEDQEEEEAGERDEDDDVQEDEMEELGYAPY